MVKYLQTRQMQDITDELVTTVCVVLNVQVKFSRTVGNC